jgi:hypothetical protein
MMKRALLLTTISLAACGVEPDLGGATPPRDVLEHSGSRLKIEHWETADGVEQLRGIYDTALGQECTFRLGADNAFACVPAGGATGEPVRATLDRQVADSAIVPLSLCTADGLVLPFGLFDQTIGAECTPRALPGAAITVCTPVGLPARATDPALAIVADSDDGHRLEAEYYATADGLRQHTGTFLDSELDMSCSVRAPSAAATAFCLPQVAVADTAKSPELPLDRFVAAIPTVDP